MIGQMSINRHLVWKERQLWQREWYRFIKPFYSPPRSPGKLHFQVSLPLDGARLLVLNSRMWAETQATSRPGPKHQIAHLWSSFLSPFGTIMGRLGYLGPGSPSHLSQESCPVRFLIRKVCIGLYMKRKQNNATSTELRHQESGVSSHRHH